MKTHTRTLLTATWSLALTCLVAAPATVWSQAAPAPAPVPAAAPAAPAAEATDRRQPPPDCLEVLDKLAFDIPREESGPALRRKGLMIKTPIMVAEEVIKDRSVVSGVRLRVMIDANGNAVPGSVVVQQAVGDVNLPLAMSEAVPQTLSFDLSAATSPPKEFPFTTVYAVCAKR